MKYFSKVTEHSNSSLAEHFLYTLNGAEILAVKRRALDLGPLSPLCLSSGFSGRLRKMGYAHSPSLAPVLIAQLGRQAWIPKRGRPFAISRVPEGTCCGCAGWETTLWPGLGREDGVPHDEPGRTGGKLRACGKGVIDHKRGDGHWSDGSWALGKG